MPDRAEVPSDCPACRSPRVAGILYGLPIFTPELQQELDQGKTVLGGCCVFGDDPQWECQACGHRWGRLD